MKKTQGYMVQTGRYFEKPGAGNTDTVLKIVGSRADQLGIQKIIAEQVWCFPVSKR